MDFASLYPSIMIAYNLCYTTYIGSQDTRNRVLEYAKKNNIPEIEAIFKTPTGHEFVTKKIKIGLLTQILKNLLGTRKYVRKQMKTVKDAMKKAVMNGRQLALKISANSVYGFTGFSQGKLPLIAISESVTSIGRSMILKTQEIVEKKYNGDKRCGKVKVIYGDSVTGDTPILCRLKNRISYKMICEIGSNFKEFNGKMVGSTPLETWSDKGWTRIKRVIKHKTNKKIFRVLTHAGCVDVTEDHSLLDENSQKISPNDCSVGTKLLHKKLPIAKSVNCDICEDKAFIWGLFMSDGSSSIYDTKWGAKYSWKISKRDLDLLKDVLKKLKRVYPSEIFKIVNSLKSSKVYNIYPSKIIKDLAVEYSKKFYSRDSKGILYKKVPDEILNTPHDTRRKFLDGYHAGDVDKNGEVRYDIKGKIGCSALYYLCNSIGRNVSVNTVNDNSYIFRSTVSLKKFRKCETKIKKIYELDEYKSQYVYDLETENHQFSAGIGKLVVHNTDSVMVDFGIDSVKEVIDLCKEASKKISDSFPGVIELEFEKVYKPYLLLGKKRYAGLKYETHEKNKGLEMKGVESLRRDAYMIVRETMDACLKMILIDNDNEKAMAYVGEVVKRVMTDEIDLSKFIATKSISRDIKDYTMPQCHTVLAQKIEKRNPGSGPRKGSRVPYVIIQGAKNDKTRDKAEDPIYVLKHNTTASTRFFSLYKS